LLELFPDREFFMRSQGQVRFIKISSRVQIVAAVLAAAMLIGWAISLAVMAWSQYRAESERASLLEREARVASAEERVGAYRHNIDAVARDLERRQAFLEEMTEALPDDIVSAKGSDDTSPVSDSRDQAAETIRKVSVAVPEAARLARVEARQLALVEKLTRFADERARRAAEAIRLLGLDPRSILRSAHNQAMGGPLEKLATSSDGRIDPRFERLGLSLARMAALEQSLDAIPQVAPAAAGSISSGFGYRRDPFTGRGAMHRGLDFKAGYGAPIFAAAKGRVSFVGRRSGYGKVVEISHGNGLMTRYAHMSRFNAKPGQKVEAGTVIGAIGSTGRSTGPHLHFEVRIHDRAVNPRPFLEKAPNVLKEVRRSSQPHGQG